MGRSSASTIVSVLSLLVAVGSVLALFSVRKAQSPGTSHVAATSYSGEDQTPLSIDPAEVKYNQIGQLAVDLKKVSAMAVGADDRIYVTGDASLCRYSPQGKLETRIPLSDQPSCLAVANRQHLAPGRIYVGFTDHIEVYDATGVKTAIWQGMGETARFTSISSSEQYIFIADAGQSVVHRFDWTGKLLEPLNASSRGHFTSVVNGASAPFDLAMGMDDLLYVVNRREHRVEGYSYGVQSELERHWGQGSPAVEDFAGASNPAHLALMASGNFVTAEDNPLRVKVYSRSGEFQAVVCGPEQTGPVVALAADQHKRVLVLDGRDRCVRVFEAKKPATADSKRPLAADLGSDL